jgi:glycine/D-amino acid oxidase-like deaminating enzyme
METFVFKTAEGFPPAFIMMDLPELQGQEIFGLLDGD